MGKHVINYTHHSEVCFSHVLCIIQLETRRWELSYFKANEALFVESTLLSFLLDGCVSGMIKITNGNGNQVRTAQSRITFASGINILNGTHHMHTRIGPRPTFSYGWHVDIPSSNCCWSQISLNFKQFTLEKLLFPEWWRGVLHYEKKGFNHSSKPFSVPKFSRP